MTGAGKTTLERSLIQRRFRVLVVDPFEEYALDTVQVHSIDDLAGAVGRSPGRWRLSYFNTHLEDDFLALCYIARDLGNCTLVIEEVDWYCGSNWLHPGLAYLLKYGRHHNVEAWCVARSYAEVNRLCTRMARCVFAFQTVEPADLDYFRAYVGRDYSEMLPKLPSDPPHNLVCLQQLRTVGAQPQFWRVDALTLAVTPLTTPRPVGVD